MGVELNTSESGSGAGLRASGRLVQRSSMLPKLLSCVALFRVIDCTANSCKAVASEELDLSQDPCRILSLEMHSCAAASDQSKDSLDTPFHGGEYNLALLGVGAVYRRISLRKLLSCSTRRCCVTVPARLAYLGREHQRGWCGHPLLPLSHYQL